MVQTPESLSIWVTQYERVQSQVDAQVRQPHPTDPNFLKYFKEVYAQPNGSRGQERAIQRIWNKLLSSGLLRISQHPAVLEAQSQTYQWLVTPIIVLSPDLLQAIEVFCTANERDRTLRLQSYLNIIQGYNFENTDLKAGKNYRDAQKNLRVNLENVLEIKTEDDQQIQECLKHLIQREPRIKFFQSYPPGSIAERFASWVNSYLYQRIQNLYKASSLVAADLSLDKMLDDYNANGGSFLDRVDDSSQPWQDTSTFDSIWDSNNLLAELSEVEETEMLEQSVKEVKPNHPLDHPHVEGYLHCTRQIVAQRLILNYPPDRLEAIAQDYKIPFKLFYRALPRTFAAIEQYYEDLGIDSQQPWRTQPELQADLLRGYIIADPDEWLSQSLNQGTYPTGQEVAERIYLKDPAHSIQAIAEEFGIIDSDGKAPDNFYHAISGTTRTNINKSRWGLIDRLVGNLVEYYPQPARLRAAITKDDHKLLESCCYSDNFPNCNAQFLALRCLKLFGNRQPLEQTLNEIAAELAQPGKKIQPGSLRNFWYTRCLPRIGRFIIILNRKDNSKESTNGGQHE